jgi:sec-independent protein translocase protein TatC
VSSDGGSTAVDEGGTDSTDDGDSIGFDNSTAAAAATAAAERRREERAAEAEQEPAADAGDRELEPEEPDVDLSFGVDDQSGPSSDEEMPLAEHIDEMVRRLAVVLAVGSVVTLLLFPGADILNAYAGTSLPTATDVINYLWNAHIPGAETVEGRRPRVYGPLELLLTELKVAGLAGFVVSLPVFVYETYLFMRPGLYPHERRYYLSAVPTSVVLAFIGIAFAHFVVLPAIFAYFTSYTTQAATVAFGLRETFSLILVLMGYMALVFQIPLFIMLAIMMNLVTRSWLEDKRLLFWGGFLGLSFIVSPDPTGMAPIIVAATMIALFEGTLALLRWTGN